MPNSIKDLVQNPHPVYQQYSFYWQFLIQSYEGGIDYTKARVNQGETAQQGAIIQTKVNGSPLPITSNSNLFKHKKERTEDFTGRVNMSYYYNFCAPIIDTYTNHLFKEPIITDFKSIKGIVEARENNIDRMGSGIDEFRREMAELAQAFGHVYILTDKPTAEGEIVSLAQQQEQGLFPYSTFFYPTDVINWALDRFGQPYWVLLRERYNSNTDPFEYSKDNTAVVQYRIWTRTEWILFNGGFEEIGRGTHNLGKVPLDVAYNKRSKKIRNFLGISEIADISFIARDVYNKCSELNEIIRNQTFAILCLQGNSKDYDELSVGTSKALLYPKETNVPTFVSPAAENANTLMTQIDRQVHKMFQLAKLEGGSATEGEDVDTQSGVSKAFDFQETNSALAKKAANMEDAEMKIWETYARWEGKKEFDGEVSYPKDFNVKDLQASLEDAEKLVKLQIGNEFDMQIKKEIIKKKFPRATDDVLNKMLKEAETPVVQGEGSALRNKLPGFFKKTPDQAVKKGEVK